MSSTADTGVSEVPLAMLRDGETGIVVSVKSGYGKAWGLKKRLMDMGITPGTRITVVKSAPFHGPMEILVRGYRLAIGRGMAERIFVRMEETRAGCAEK